ncbi:peptidase inhibitor family I36 protein [Streptomyces sp. NBC_01498]|uniref:peptidase inhibitor family I36 protein n=1 Tax=Streptomyces sp. NBC_01498 TaxID=2975870 RepID=UPI002E7C0C14|nr:peptidase inhibitor family I36 protein [Streptomyces sp. NBC_01498]WTL27091.1 peptidase inhibitor family I36 protein [Streptomyces sp. NBC_01498]
MRTTTPAVLPARAATRGGTGALTRGARHATLLTAATLAAATALLPAATPAASAVAVPRGACGPGELCLWGKPDFKGARQIHELFRTEIQSCVPLPPGTDAQSLANRTGRPVTTYQSHECEETGEFETYPGKGTWVPQSPYRVRAFKVWER